MEVMFAEHELHNACQILFGADIQVSRSFLEYLQLSGIKSAYRKKALETHPDKIVSLNGQFKSTSSDLFISVQQAYESLICYINARKNGHLFPDQEIPQSRPATPQKPRPSPRPARPYGPYHNMGTMGQTGAGNSRTHGQQGPARPQANNGSRFYQATPLYTGSIPSRKLLFGHYLYYSGVTNWSTIIKALVWQRTKRPRIGEIGCRYGWLTDEDILAILQRRPLSESFGKSAVDLGFLTEQQLNLLVYQQERLQKKFGDFFVANNLLSAYQLEQLVNEFRNHNLSVPAKQTRYRTM